MIKRITKQEASTKIFNRIGNVNQETLNKKQLQLLQDAFAIKSCKQNGMIKIIDNNLDGFSIDGYYPVLACREYPDGAIWIDTINNFGDKDYVTNDFSDFKFLFFDMESEKCIDDDEDEKE